MVSLILQQKFEEIEKPSTLANSQRGIHVQVSSNFGTKSNLNMSFKPDNNNQDHKDSNLLHFDRPGKTRMERKASLNTKLDDIETNSATFIGSVADIKSQQVVEKKQTKRDTRRYTKFVPELCKKDIDNMVPDDRDEIIEESERLTINWVHAFLEEINRVEQFFITK